MSAAVPHPSRLPVFAHGALVVLSAAGAALLAYATAHGGLGLTPDSIEYLAAARSFGAGEGFVRFAGTPYSLWPPLYPAVLWLAGLLGGVFALDPITSARLVHLVLFAALVYLSGRLFLRVVQPPLLALVGTGAVVFSLPLVQATAFLWSEPLFIVISLLVFATLTRYLAAPTRSGMLALIVLAGLACLQRYMGVALVATVGGCLLVFRSAPSLPDEARGRRVWRALGETLVFGVGALAPLGVWSLRNLALGTGAAGDRRESVLTLYEATSRTSDTWLSWLWQHPQETGLFPLGLIVIAGAAAALIVWAAVQAWRGDTGVVARMPVVAAAFVVVYPATLLAAHLRIILNEIANRDLVPTYIYLIVLVFYGVSGAMRLATRRNSPPDGARQPARTVRPPRVWFEAAAVAVALVWLVGVPVQMAWREVSALHTWCCQHDEWDGLTLTAWLREHPLDGVVMSNSTLPLMTVPLGYGRVTRTDNTPETLAAADWAIWYSDADLCQPDSYHCIDYDFSPAALGGEIVFSAEGEGAVYRMPR